MKGKDVLGGLRHKEVLGLGFSGTPEGLQPVMGATAVGVAGDNLPNTVFSFMLFRHLKGLHVGKGIRYYSKAQNLDQGTVTREQILVQNMANS